MQASRTSLVGLTYDAAGNVTNDGNGNTPTYDAENRIITDAGVTCSYDAGPTGPIMLPRKIAPAASQLTPSAPLTAGCCKNRKDGARFSGNGEHKQLITAQPLPKGRGTS
jgi:hypothetical protein